MQLLGSQRLLTLVVGTVTTAAVLFVLLRSFLAAEVASTLALGLSVGGCVYLDRRVGRRRDRAAVEGLLHGAATAMGWAGGLAAAALIS